MLKKKNSRKAAGYNHHLHLVSHRKKQVVRPTNKKPRKKATSSLNAKGAKARKSPAGRFKPKLIRGGRS